MILSIVLCFIASVILSAKSFENEDELTSSNFFIRCDFNKDKSLTITEINSCIRKYSDFEQLSGVLNSDGTKFIGLIDDNKDNKISLKEYVSFLNKQKHNSKHVSNDGTVTVKTRDGKVKDMTREEMQSKMSDSMKGNLNSI